jgi:Uma2 family endonuclease
MLMAEIQQKLYTVEDLWELQGESDEYKLAELIRGELIMVGGSGGEATIIAGFILRKIGNYSDEHKLGYVTGADGHYVVSTNPDTAVIPDVGFIKKERMPKPVPKKYIHATPDLAVEVISPTDKAKEIREKIELYLEHKTELVWVVYPSSERVDVYRAADKAHVEVVKLDGVLDGENVLPGFKLSVQEIFAVLE